MPKSIYLEKQFLDETFGNTAKPSRANLFIALFTVSPTASSDSGTEVSGGSYARKSVTNNATNFPAATHSGSIPATKANGTSISFVAATGSWGTILAFGIYDASTAGNLLYWGAVTPVQIISSGGTFTIGVGQMVFTEK